jgi:O-antigen/teichoic acid export membrane protein
VTENGVAEPAVAPPTGGSLRSTVRRGAVASATALVVVQVIAFAQTLVLGRVLGPVEIGVYTAGTVTVVFLLAVSDGGVRAALIRWDEDALEEAANTGFWSTLAAGTGVGLATLLVSPLLATLVDDPRAGWICAASSGAPVVHALTIVPDALLQRRFDFRRRRMVVDPSVALGFAVPAVVLCLTGLGIWGMVVALYTSNLAFVITTWWLARWRPGAARPTWRTWRRMARYGAPVAAGAVTDRARAFLESALVGRLLGVGPLGLYRYGRRLGELPGRSVVEVGEYVLLPTFATIASDRDRFRAVFLRSLRLAWAGSLPVAAVLATVGTPVVVVMLGEQWRGAGVVLETMAAWGPGAALISVAAGAIKGAGHSRLLNRMTVSNLVLGLGLLVVLAPVAGLAGVGLTVSLERVFTGLVGLLAVRTLLGITGGAIVGVLLVPTLAGVTAGAVGVALERGLVRAGQAPALGPALLGIVLEALVVLGVYAVLLAALDRSARHDLVAVTARLRRGVPRR